MTTLSPGTWQELFLEEARILGLSLDASILPSFEAYMRELLIWNRRINLTRIVDPKLVAVNHFLDSLTPLPYLPPRITLLDLGSGAGFPGIPLKIAAPALEVTLAEASLKKVHFLKHIIRTLKLTGIQIRAARIGPGLPGMMGNTLYDRILFRAVGPAPKILPAAWPLLAPGGVVILMKGNKEKALAEAQAAEKTSPLTLERHITFSLPRGGGERTLLFWKLEARASVAYGGQLGLR